MLKTPDGKAATSERSQAYFASYVETFEECWIVKNGLGLVNCRSRRSGRHSQEITDMPEPKQASLDKMWKYVRGFAEKSGTTMHPNPSVTEAVVKGLALHVDELGKPLCPCNFYKDKVAEAKLRRWICACDEMQIYKYCHCLLFVREDGMPITEYLPEGHEGREVYGVITDPTPEKGRALRHKAEAPLSDTQE